MLFIINKQHVVYYLVARFKELHLFPELCKDSPPSNINKSSELASDVCTFLTSNVNSIKFLDQIPSKWTDFLVWFRFVGLVRPQFLADFLQFGREID